MAAVLEPRTDDPEAQQLETLEKMVAAFCTRVTQLANEFRSQHTTLSRETTLQLMAFDERREQALTVLRDAPSGPRQFRIGRLEQLVEALHCSWDYFTAQQDLRVLQNAPSDWAVLVR